MKKLFLKLIPPTSIWILGISSSLISISNLMVFSLMGVYSLHVLEISPLIIGLIEGVTEFFDWITRLLAGRLSDYFRRRKNIIVIGYVIFLISRIMLLFTNTTLGISCARLVDRIGYGVQAAPREALVADLSPLHQRGASYGLRHALSIIGSTVGAFGATYILTRSNGNYNAVFLLSGIPAIMALLLLFKVHDKTRPKAPVRRVSQSPSFISIKEGKVSIKDFLTLGKRYWCFIWITFLFALSHYSPIFLTLQAEPFGLALERVPLVMAVYSVVEALTSYPIGFVSDYINRKIFVFLGFVILILTNYVLGYATELWQVFLGIILWGIQLGLTKGTFLALVADFSPFSLRATAFGMFYFMTGVAYFFSNFLSGWLSFKYGLDYMFIIKGNICLITTCILLYMKVKKIF